MSRKEGLIEALRSHGIKFPSRHRFVLGYKNGNLKIFTSENKGKIKLENEKFSNNRSILLDGTATALLDIREVESAEEYADILIKHLTKWGLLEEELN